jgi:hypothetical protein
MGQLQRSLQVGSGGCPIAEEYVSHPDLLLGKDHPANVAQSLCYLQVSPPVLQGPLYLSCFEVGVTQVVVRPAGSLEVTDRFRETYGTLIRLPCFGQATKVDKPNTPPTLGCGQQRIVACLLSQPGGLLGDVQQLVKPAARKVEVR